MKNIYFTTNSDGGSTEGIGAMAQYQIICYALSRYLDTKYTFSGFHNLSHYQYFEISPNQWSEMITRFFNLRGAQVNSILSTVQFNGTLQDLQNLCANSDNVLILLDPQFLMRTVDLIIDSELCSKAFQSIKDSLVFDTKQIYFDRNSFNISFHIRRFTKTDNCTASVREYYSPEKISKYKNTIALVYQHTKHLNPAFHIYSQGIEADFDQLRDPKLNINFHIEEVPTTSLYHMIHSDMLICANSSFSYVAHLLNQGCVSLGRDSFVHKWKLDSINLDIDGGFETNILKKQLYARYN